MTNRELQQHLKQYPDDLEVFTYIDTDSSSGLAKYTEIDIEIDTMKESGVFMVRSTDSDSKLSILIY